MADSYTQVPPDSTGDKIDTEQLTVSAQTVERQRIQVAGTADVDIAPVDGTAGLKVDLGTDNNVAVDSIAAGDNNIGNVDVLTSSGQAAEAAALPGVFNVVAGDDGTDTHPLQVAADGDLKVTLDSEAVVLGAGTAEIGKLAAGTANIGDVDVLSVITGVGATNLGKAVSATAGAADTGVAGLATRDDALGGLSEAAGEYANLRVDADGALWVIPSGTTAVSGTVTADAGTGTFNVDLDSLIGTAIDVNNGSVSGGTQRVTIADDSTGTINVASSSGQAAEAAALPGVFNVVAGDDGTDTHPLQLAADGDLKVTLDSEAVVLGAGTAEIGKLAAGSANIGDVDVLTVPALVAGTAKIGSALASGTHLYDGLAGAPGEVEVKFAVVDEATAADNEIVALVASKSIRVLSYVLVASGGANTVTWKSATAGNISGGMGVADTGGISANSETGLFQTTAGEALELTLSAATSVDGHISYIEVD